MAKYEPTIGLEIHAELKTQTKMFCDSFNDPDERHANVNICPVCTGQPGTLPVINKAAVDAVLKVGMALNGDIPQFSKFDRKNYFYPDLPKGYQISQYDLPLIFGGILNGVRLRRIHLEEDTGRLLHTAPRSNDERMSSNESRIFEGNSTALDKNSGVSLVDYNRAGVPLMELVTEPDIKSAEQAVEFARELQLILRYLGVSDADMEKGGLRIEVNISLRPNDNRIEPNDDRIVLKEESYKLMGLLFEIHNKLGSVFKEKNYQDAIAEILRRENIPFEREKALPLLLDGAKVSDLFADFIMDNQILLEVKTTKFITQEDIRQILRYIKVADVPLGIIVNFRRGAELEYKRVINPKFDKDSMSFVNNLSETSLGTKVEVKNINSFRAVHDAIEYEIKRQTEKLASGEKVVQETRGWDDGKKATVSQRLKEEAHEYRYFPEPDLPPLDLSKFDLASIKTAIPELPKEKRLRFIKEYSLTPEQAELLVAERATAQYFEEAVSEMEADNPAGTEEKIKLIFNYFTTDLRGLMAEQAMTMDELKIQAEDFADLVELVYSKEISSRGAKEILKKMLETGLDPREVLKQQDLRQVSNEGQLKKVAEKIIIDNPNPVADYKKGKENALQFLVGKAMAELKGRGNPGVLQKLFRELLTK